MCRICLYFTNLTVMLQPCHICCVRAAIAQAPPAVAPCRALPGTASVTLCSQSRRLPARSSTMCCSNGSGSDHSPVPAPAGGWRCAQHSSVRAAALNAGGQVACCCRVHGCDAKNLITLPCNGEEHAVAQAAASAPRPAARILYQTWARLLLTFVHGCYRQWTAAWPHVAIFSCPYQSPTHLLGGQQQVSIWCECHAVDAPPPVAHPHWQLRPRLCVLSQGERVGIEDRFRLRCSCAGDATSTKTPGAWQQGQWTGSGSNTHSSSRHAGPSGDHPPCGKIGRRNSW